MGFYFKEKILLLVMSYHIYVILQYKPDGQVHCLSIASIILQTRQAKRYDLLYTPFIKVLLIK